MIGAFVRMLCGRSSDEQRRLEFLRAQFSNADELHASLVNRGMCDRAIRHDGTTLVHPQG
jgi:hypothetical protein